jgi:site-specific DNA-methyltransferase (adenine-specific)
MITIEQKLYDKMPSDLKAMFIKLPNQTSDEVLSAFPDAKGQCGDLIGHDHDIKSPNDIFGVMPPRYDAYKREDDSKSASRFFFCAKASKSERNKGCDKFEEQATTDGRDKSIDNAFLLGETQRKNNHPTVKPVSLMRYLCRMITPKRGIVLDPFMGSGSTGIGAKVEGFSFIGIEKETGYCKIAEARIGAWEEEKPPKMKIIEPTLF